MTRRPIAVLLLPAALEDAAMRGFAEDLLRAPGVVALEPGVLPWATRGQARRLLRRLPGRLAAVVAFDTPQLPLARELAERARGEVWWGGPPQAGAGPDAKLTFVPAEDALPLLRAALRRRGGDADPAG